MTDIGEQGLAVSRQASADLVVLKMMLPKLDGLTVCCILRGESQMPIILLTARGMETEKAIGQETGADDCIANPSSLEKSRLEARRRSATCWTSSRMSAPC